MGAVLRRPARLLGALAAIALALVPAWPAAAAPAPRAAPTTPGSPLVLTTVPRVAGFPVTVDGITVLTDARGRASFDLPTSDEDLSQRVTLTEAVLPIQGQDVKVRADRVYPSVTRPLLALDMSYLVTFRFLAPDGSVVDPAGIGNVSLKSEAGEFVELGPERRAWLQGNRVIKRSDRMEVKNLLWSLQRVEFASANVVNTSQQRFYPAERQAVDVDLLFFELEVAVHDAIYGHTAGDAVELLYPDGQTRRVPLDGTGRVTIADLPRGQYGLTIVGSGPRISRPLAVSRDQTVELAFHSWLDVATVLGGLFALAVGLLVVGWRRRTHDRSDLPRPVRRGARLRAARLRTAGADDPEDEDVDLPVAGTSRVRA